MMNFKGGRLLFYHPCGKLVPIKARMARNANFLQWRILLESAIIFTN